MSTWMENFKKKSGATSLPHGCPVFVCMWVAVWVFVAVLVLILQNDLGRGKNDVSRRDSPCS